MICSKCKTENPDDAKFCSHCGSKMKTEEEHKKQVDFEKQKRTERILIFSVIEAFLCSLPFGIAALVINEIKVKPAYRDGDYVSGDKMYQVTLVLLIIGVVSGVFIRVLQIFNFFIQLALEVA